MFVSIIFDTEYMGMGERIKWFLKNLSHAKELNSIVITHEYLKSNYRKLLDGCADRFFEEFEMRHISEQEMEQIDIYYMPDSFFQKLEETCQTRSRAIVELTYNRNMEFEKHILSFIEAGLAKRKGEGVDGIFNCLHCLESINYIAKLYHCPVIPYVFSAIRKVHGYKQTLYMANMSAGLMNNDDIKNLYRDFIANTCQEIIPLNKKEILALLGKEKHLPLLPLLNREGNYELGIANGGYRITPQSYAIDGSTDDDIYYEAGKYYNSSEIISRLHPMMLDQIGIGRQHIHNDPVSFILGCKRVATIQSQLIIKAALWNRIPCVLSDALPYGFLCAKDIVSHEAMSDEKLNFILFCYFIPNSCMFNKQYWLWRMKKPGAKDIYIRHLEEILNNVGYSKNAIYMKSRRLEYFLEMREMPITAINKVLNDCIEGEIDYDYISSMLYIKYTDGEEKNYYCMNYICDKNIVSRFYTEKKRIAKMIFYPLDGCDGFVKIVSRKIKNEILIFNNQYEYCPKGEEKFVYENLMGEEDVIFKWKAKAYDAYLASKEE